jgi:hypothetical protein
VLAIAAGRALVRDAGVEAAALAGPRTALVHVTAAAYGASNRIFIDADASPGVTGALHFPYTAPSTLPAEVAIEFGITGPYLILIGGATATVDAFWHVGQLFARRAADRALVLAVETFAECGDLHARARWLTGRPRVEAAACALLIPEERGLDVREGAAPSAAETGAAGIGEAWSPRTCWTS